MKFHDFYFEIEEFDTVFDGIFNFEIGFGVRRSKVAFSVAFGFETRFKDDETQNIGNSNSIKNQTPKDNHQK